MQAVFYLIPVVNVADRDSGKSDDGIHRGADIVGHVGKECGFCAVCMLRLHKRILKSLGLRSLLFDLLRYFF